MNEKTLRGQLPDEPTYAERRKQRHEEEFGKLSPMLRELADFVWELTQYYDYDEQAAARERMKSHHSCALPVHPLGALEDHSAHSEFKCTECGQQWVYSWLARTWHPKV